MPVCAGSVDIRVLCPLVASAKQQNHLCFGDGVIDPESRSGVDPQFPHSIAAKPVIAEVAQFHSVDSAINCDLCFRIAKLVTPFHEDVFLASRKVVQNLVHRSIIVYKRMFVNMNPGSYLMYQNLLFLHDKKKAARRRPLITSQSAPLYGCACSPWLEPGHTVDVFRCILAVNQLLSQRFW